MKIIKTASGKNKIKISRKEWTNIGKKAGWMQKSAYASGEEVFELSDWIKGNANIHPSEIVKLPYSWEIEDADPDVGINDESWRVYVDPKDVTPDVINVFETDYELPDSFDDKVKWIENYILESQHEEWDRGETFEDRQIGYADYLMDQLKDDKLTGDL